MPILHTLRYQGRLAPPRLWSRSTSTVGGITLEVDQVVHRHRRRRFLLPPMLHRHRLTPQIIMALEILISADVSLSTFNNRPFARTTFVPCLVLCSIGRSQLNVLTSLEPVSPDFGFVQMNENLPQYTKITGEL